MHSSVRAALILVAPLLGAAVDAVPHEECTDSVCTQLHAQTPGFEWTEEMRARTVPVSPQGWPKPNISMPDTSLALPTQVRSCLSPRPILGSELARFPDLAVVRIYFHESGDMPSHGHRCSGSWIQPHLILTAGHCCFNTQKQAWSRDWLATDEYGLSKSRTFKARTAHISPAWKRHDHRYDWCFLVMQSSPGYHMGLSWYSKYQDKIESYGYAANYGHGQVMYMATGYAASLYGSSAAGTVKMACNPMHAGNSGGPWIMDGRVVGLNSYHSGGVSAREEFSPRFGSDWLTNYNHAKNLAFAAEVAASRSKNWPGQRSISIIVAAASGSLVSLAVAFILKGMQRRSTASTPLLEA